MAYVAKKEPGTAPGYEWHEAGEVVQIDDPELVAILVLIPDGGFSVVDKPNKPATKRTGRTSKTLIHE